MENNVILIVIGILFVIFFFVVRWYIDKSIQENNKVIKNDLTEVMLEVLKKYDPVYLLINDKDRNQFNKKTQNLKENKIREKVEDSREDTIKDIV